MAILDLTGGSVMVLPVVGPPGPAIEGPPGPVSTVPGPRGETGKQGPAGSPTTQTYQAVFDQDYTAGSTVGQVGYRTLTAQRTMFFPDVDTYPFNKDFVLADASGQCSPDRPILMAPGVNTGDQIGNGSQIALSSPNQGFRFRRGGVNLWILV